MQFPLVLSLCTIKLKIELMTYQDVHVSVVLLHDIPSQLTLTYESFFLYAFTTKEENMI